MKKVFAFLTFVALVWAVWHLTQYFPDESKMDFNQWLQHWSPAGNEARGAGITLWAFVSLALFVVLLLLSPLAVAVTLLGCMCVFGGLALNMVIGYVKGLSHRNR